MSKLDELSTFTDLSYLLNSEEIPKRDYVSKDNITSKDIKTLLNEANYDGNNKFWFPNSNVSIGSSIWSSNIGENNYPRFDKIRFTDQSVKYFLKDNAMNKVFIDVAVVSEEYNKIELMCDDHIVNLDEIDVSMEIFQTMFYPYKSNFGINRDFFLNSVNLMPFISFSHKFRTINGKHFDLLEELISNIETDLSVSRNCFTKDSLVELTNEITNIKSLLDIKCCSVMSSLTWENILDIINNYKLTKSEVIPVLIINIIFKSDTANVKDTIVRFQYKICTNV